MGHSIRAAVGNFWRAPKGHKTRSVFDRYNITSEADLKDAAEKLAKHLAAKREKPSE